MKYLLDTNVYLDASRSAARRDQFRTTFFPLLPATYLSAVVAYELMVNAADRRTRTSVEDFIRPLERTGRLVTPTFDDWVEASALVTAIELRDRGLTRNRDDFLLIRRHKGFSLRILD